MFVEETIRMLVEQGEGAAVRIPDTLQALIAARIDALPPDSRSVLRHGALVGRVFWRGAIADLDPELDVDGALQDLADRQLVTREPLSTVSGEVAYRFRHVLIRDVAYGGLAKSVRATLHRTFAEWLARPLARRARRDAGIPPRARCDAPRGARGTRARRAARPRRLLHWSWRVVVRSSARRTGGRGGCCCGRSSSSRP